ncbi:MAG: hypothetical protein HQK67_11775 [Desulfamplus sp.]|nr:hypothetical protein [Desulfamplus sp.]
MSDISRLGPSVGGLQNRGDLGEFGSLSQKREALQASQSKNLELSLTTKEGDVVTLSAGAFMDFASLSYDKSGRISNGSENVSARSSSREMTLASGSQFTFSVKGSLSEQEMNDIENIVKTLDEVINKMSTGNMDDAVAKALEMQDGYDSVSGFEANLSTSSSYSFEKEIAKQAYYADSGDKGNFINRGHGRIGEGNNNGSGVQGSGLNQDELMPEIAKDSSTRLMDMMLKELKKLQEKNQGIPRKAEEPVDQLLAHHMDQLKKLGEINKQDGMNGTEDYLNKLQDNLNKNQDSQGKNIDDMLSELANARKGMAQEFRQMMPEIPSFRQMAAPLFDL